MLFLLSLYCFADTMNIGGTKFDVVIQTYNPNINKKGAAVFIVNETGELISTGTLRPKTPTTLREKIFNSVHVNQKKSVNLTQNKIPTQQWRGEKIQPVVIEIFGTHQCPYCRDAKDLALETFGKEIGEENVKSYHIDDDLTYRQKSQDILNAAGSNLKTVPRISVIDANNTRWFIGGFSPDFTNFVDTHKNMSATSVLKTDFTKLDLPNPELYTLGMSVRPIQIEIFGADYCPACVNSKALATQTFGDNKVQFYDIKKSYQYRSKSDSFLRIVRWPDTSMPRICVIYDRGNGPERLFLGGFPQLRNFINSMSKTRTMVRQQPQRIQRIQSGSSKPSGIWSNWG